MNGGGQERGLRSGTLPAPLCVGMGRAAAVCAAEMAHDTAHVNRLWARLYDGITTNLTHVFLNGHMTQRYRGNLNASFAYVEGESLLMALKDVAVSSGSACTSASLEPSYVLRALNVDEDLAHSSLRFGVGRFTTEAEIDYAISVCTKHVTNLRWPPSACYCRRCRSRSPLRQEHVAVVGNGSGRHRHQVNRLGCPLIGVRCSGCAAGQRPVLFVVCCLKSPAVLSAVAQQRHDVIKTTFDLFQSLSQDFKSEPNHAYYNTHPVDAANMVKAGQSSAAGPPPIPAHPCAPASHSSSTPHSWAAALAGRNICGWA